MNILIFILITIVAFIVAYKLYSSFLAAGFGENDSIKTPAVEINDGVDYVPGRFVVVFSHHFASIAGAGPIIGPTVALAYGFFPCWMWILIGSIFVGAVHDYSSLFVSLREKGLSMAEVARRSMGTKGFTVFILFTIIMLAFVTSAFLSLTSAALTSKIPLEALNLSPDQKILNTITDDKGTVLGLIGGIASTSVIIITFFAPLFGYLLYKKRIHLGIAIISAIIICIASIILGFRAPLQINPKTWMIILSVYCLGASWIPVWIILQPRDFINSFVLYFGIIFLFIGSLIGGFKGATITAPMFDIEHGSQALGPIFPMLFITIACGAVSGFHALVSGGTTSKQCRLENYARKIGFGGMLLEGVLAALVLVAVASFLDFGKYSALVFPKVPNVPSNPILAFAIGLAAMLNQTIGIPMHIGSILGILLVEGFLATTLDTAIRLNRYLFEELWRIIFIKPPKFIMSSFFNSALSVVIMFYLAYTQGFKTIWSIFGTANQLLAALTLIAITLWFIHRGKIAAPVFLAPALFMMVTTITSLFYLLLNHNGYIAKKNTPLIISDIILIALSFAVLGIGINVLHKNKFLSFKKLLKF